MKKLVLLAFLILQSYALGQQVNPPPNKPVIGAVMGDRKVTLYWNDLSEQADDFEGYLILRSTDPDFKEVQTITDGFGNPTYFTPIAQFDKENYVTGPHPVAVNGIKFYLGDDTGIVHTWTDSGQVSDFPLRNGQTYYYTICSYDHGNANLGLPPSISNLDENLNFIFDDSNTVVITPNAPAAGYISPQIIIDNYTSKGLIYLEYVDQDSAKTILDLAGYPIFEYRVHGGDFLYPTTGPGTGNISVKIIDPSKIKEGHVYQVTFEDTGYFHQTVEYTVIDVTSGDTLIQSSKYLDNRDIQKVLNVGGKYEYIGDPIEHRKLVQYFDGMSFHVFNHPQVSFTDSLSGWVAGNCNYEYHAEFVANQILRIVYPADYEIRFFNQVVDTSINGSIPTNFQVWNVTDNLKTDFRFEDRDNNTMLSTGDNVYPVIYVDSDTKYPWKISFKKPIDQLKGNYLNLDGSDDYTTIPDNLSLDIGDDSTESITVEAWIYPKSFGNYIVSDEGYSLSTVSGKGVKFVVKNGGIVHSITETDANFQTNRWHHIVGMFDNSANKIGVGFDGNIIWSGEDTTTFNLDNNDSPLYVGSFDDFQGFYNGAMDELRLSDIVRYPSTSYERDSTFTPDVNTRALWHFNEFAGSTSFSDTSSNGNTLIAQGEASSGPLVLIAPVEGDVFRVHCTKPFRGSWINASGDTLDGDVFQFKTAAEYSEINSAKNQLDNIAVVPNPYTGAASWETNPAFGSGERKIYFIHLPPNSTIRIYTISGHLVDKITHDDPVHNGAEAWDLKSKEGIDIAYGVYIYHVDAPGIGEKIGKFALIK
jgi:hypothetical protein